MRSRENWKGALRAGAVLLGTGAILWRAGEAVKLAAWALIAAALAEGPVEALRPRVGRMLAAVLVTAGTLMLAIGVAGAVLLPTAAQLRRLPLFLEKAGNALEELAPELRMEGTDMRALLAAGGRRIVSAAAEACASLGTGLAHLAAVCALTVFFLMDWEHLSLRVALLVPSPWRGKAIGAARAVRRDLGGYLRGQLIVVFLVSALTAAALFMARAPLPLAMGVMYGALNALPYVGPFIATLPPVLSSLALGWRQAGMTLIILLIIQQIDNYVISPRVLGTASGLGPAMVLLSIAAGSALGGVWGMVVALPAAVAARSVYRAFWEASN